MRRPLPILAIALAVIAGCGSSDEDAPAACLSPPDAYLDALRRAPGTVRLADGIPISDCLTREQPPAQLAEVGRSMIGAATALNAQGRRPRTCPASRNGCPAAVAVRLGYLVGAARKGASGTGGIHADLVRRLESAARFGGPRAGAGASFRRGYGRGYAAGRKTG